MRPIEALVETAIYADDLDLAAGFYREVLGLDLTAREAGRHVFFRVGDRSMLLIFRQNRRSREITCRRTAAGVPGMWHSGYRPRIFIRGGRILRVTGSRSSTRSHAQGPTFALFP